MGEAHDVVGGLDVAVADGQRGAAGLGRAALQVALLLHLSPHGGVPVVLYSVVGPAGHKKTTRLECLPKKKETKKKKKTRP